MRKWKILVEVGGDSSQNETAAIPPPASPDNRRTAWDKLLDERRKFVESTSKGDTRAAENAAMWLGGGVAVLAIMTREDPKDLIKSLEDAIPALPRQGVSGPAYAGDPRLRIDETYVPPPLPPGAPRKLDLSKLTDEERERMGILPSGDVIIGIEPDDDNDLS